MSKHEGEKEEKSREKREEKRDNRGEWISCVIWTSPRHHLTIILTPFDHFNSLNCDMS